MEKIYFNEYSSAFSYAKKKEFEKGELLQVKKVGEGVYQVVSRKKPTIKKAIDVASLKRKMFGDMFNNDALIDLKIKEMSRTRRPKNVEWKNTYCNEKFGNVRYTSQSKRAIHGWAYIFTQDNDYVYDLSFHRTVQVKQNGVWIPYQGHIPEEIETSDSDNAVAPDDWVEGYDY